MRAVLAVALAVALTAAVAPAVDDARTTRTDRLAARELGRIETASMSLVAEDAPGARRTLDVSLPGGSPTAAPLAFVALGGLPDGATVGGTGGVGHGRTGRAVAGGADAVLDAGADEVAVGGTDAPADDGTDVAAGAGKRASAVDTADGDVLAYRVAGERTRVRRIDVDLRVVRDGTPVESDSRGVVLRGGESYRLTLRLVRIEGQQRVVVKVRRVT